MEIPITFPTDSDGFLRRECPNCEFEFKWHNGPLSTRPEDAVDPEFFSCPLCGESAAHDQWFTQDQVSYQRGIAEFYMNDAVNEALKKEFGGIKGISYKPGRSTAAAPQELVEPDDMIIVEPPCHPWEPIKVPEVRADAGPIYCLICSAQFQV